MDILKRTIAPIIDNAWDEIEEQAKLTLKGNLSARGIVDFSGPHGMKKDSVNLGKVEKGQTTKGVTWGIRKVLPLVEMKVPFKLSLTELDDVSRGLKNPELDAVEGAARNAALFEENALYHGFPKAGIEGIIPSSPHKAVSIPANVSKYPEAIEQAILTLEQAGIGGDYTLVLGTETYSILMQGDEKGYPLNKRVADMIRGKILWSPALTGGVLISTRGGDYEMVVGQDFSLGYSSHTSESVELFLMESFTFQVLEPRAAVELKPKKK